MVNAFEDEEYKWIEDFLLDFNDESEVYLESEMNLSALHEVQHLEHRMQNLVSAYNSCINKDETEDGVKIPIPHDIHDALEPNAEIYGWKNLRRMMLEESPKVISLNK